MLVPSHNPGLDPKFKKSGKTCGAHPPSVTRWDRGRHGGPPPLEERQRKPLTLEDARALEERCLAVKNVTAFITSEWDVPHSVRTKSGEVNAIDFRGVQPNFVLVYANAATLSGRFISEGDYLHKQKVVMLCH